ncbi:hypothetical protein [Prevotella sp. HCN-7019]|uniref:hypothetical protein n=1 Tax=Prevotella sp. HCN-7019 TaxID=3134668 RepID=UPI00262B0FA1
MNKYTYTATRRYKHDPLGVNLEMRLGNDFLMLYGWVGLTPVLTTNSALKCHAVSLGMGVRL